MSPDLGVGERELAGSPSLAAAFARAGLSMVPGVRRVPGRDGGGSGEIPEAVLVLRDLCIDRDRLAAYDRVCGFDLSDALPLTYPHALIFPLQLALMTDSRFPVRAIGLVHIANTIVQRRAIGADEALSLRVWAEGLRPHPRGRAFDLRSEVRVGAELVWEEAATNLARGERDDAVPAPPEPGGGAVDFEALAATASWQLPGDLGRRYGGVSGDLNPIHVNRYGAKLFGFSRAIAHGMWTAARCVAQLGPAVPDAARLEVVFRRPILLPASVAFAERPAGDGGGRAFAVRSPDSGTAHLDGLLTPAAGDAQAIR